MKKLILLITLVGAGALNGMQRAEPTTLLELYDEILSQTHGYFTDDYDLDVNRDVARDMFKGSFFEADSKYALELINNVKTAFENINDPKITKKPYIRKHIQEILTNLNKLQQAVEVNKQLFDLEEEFGGSMPMRERILRKAQIKI